MALKEIRNALITGTSSGIGMVTSVEMARQGYHVIASMRDTGKAERLLKLATESGVSERIEIMELDLSIGSEAIESTILDVIERKGHLDVLVNNAGITEVGPVEMVRDDQWRRVMETNFFGALSCIRAVIPHFRERHAGYVINVSSINGRVSGAGNGPYAASKFALEAMSEALRFEMLPFGVKVVIVQPGAFRTDIWGRDYELTLDEGNPYRDIYKGFSDWAQIAPTVAGDPIEVGRLICQIVADENPTLRYPVGNAGNVSAGDLIRRYITEPWEKVESEFK